MKVEASEVMMQLSRAESKLEEVLAQESGNVTSNSTHNVTSNGTKLRKASAKNASSVGKKNRTQLLKQEQEVLKNLFAHLKQNVMKFNKAEEDGKGRNKEMLE